MGSRGVGHAWKSCRAWVKMINRATSWLQWTNDRPTWTTPPVLQSSHWRTASLPLPTCQLHSEKALRNCAWHVTKYMCSWRLNGEISILDSCVPYSKQHMDQVNPNTPTGNIIHKIRGSSHRHMWHPGTPSISLPFPSFPMSRLWMLNCCAVSWLTLQRSTVCEVSKGGKRMNFLEKLITGLQLEKTNRNLSVQ